MNGKEPVFQANPDWIMEPYGKELIDKNDEEMITTQGTVYVDGVPELENQML